MYRIPDVYSRKKFLENTTKLVPFIRNLQVYNMAVDSCMIAAYAEITKCQK